MCMINCILLVLLLVVSMVLLKCTNPPLVIHFLNFVRLFRLQVLLIITLPVSFVIFFHLQFLMIFCKDTFSFVSQIKNANLSKKFLVSYDVTSLFTNISLQETIDIAINLIFNHNSNLNITKKELKNFSFLLHRRLLFFGKFYNQIHRVVVVSPLAPVVANIFMGFYESENG